MGTGTGEIKLGWEWRDSAKKGQTELQGTHTHTYTHTKRQPIEWEKILCSYKYSRELVSTILKRKERIQRTTKHLEVSNSLCYYWEVQVKLTLFSVSLSC